MFGGLANLEACFTVHGRTDSDRAVVTLDVEECDDRGSWGFRDQQSQPLDAAEDQSEQGSGDPAGRPDRDLEAHLGVRVNVGAVDPAKLHAPCVRVAFVAAPAPFVRISGHDSVDGDEMSATAGHRDSEQFKKTRCRVG